MILEVKVVGSSEWYEQVYPKLNAMGFEEIKDLWWADPETDGEYMGFYFNYTRKEGMIVSEFAEFIKDMEQIIMDGEAPIVSFSIIADKKPVSAS